MKLLSFLKTKFEEWRVNRVNAIREKISCCELMIAQCKVEIREGVSPDIIASANTMFLNEDEVSWLRECESFYERLAPI